MASPHTFRGETSAQRQARRRSALIEATLDLVYESGLQSVGVRSACACAGLTSRYFYESFASLDELLVATHEQIADEVLAAGAAALHQDSRSSAPRARLRSGLAAAVGIVVDDPRKGTFVAALAAGDTKLQRRRREIVLRVADAVLAETAPGQASCDARARSVTLYVAGGLVELTVAFLAGDLDLERGRLIDQLTTLTAGVAAAGFGAASPARARLQRR